MTNQCYDYLLKLSTAELYGEKTYLIQDYQDYLKSIGEHSKSYAIQEKWIKAMQEIGVESQIKCNSPNANKCKYIAMAESYMNKKCLIKKKIGQHVRHMIFRNAGYRQWRRLEL